MKLAEALMLRADYQVRINKLKSRILSNLVIQEGDEVTEDPNVLRSELRDTIVKLTDLIKRINKTNCTTLVFDETTIADALAHRDSLKMERDAYETIVQNASIKHNRISHSEIKYISTINVPKIQKDIDRLSKDLRVLDTKIQEKNWLIELV